MYDINYRLISSYLFYINVCFSYYNKYYIYTILFSNLLISSVILHWLQYDLNYMNDEIIMVKKIDKFNIFLIILYGTYIYFKKLFCKKNNFILLATVIYSVIICGFLWNYGYYKNKYCFDKSEIIASRYHSILHFFSILGHFIIILL